MARRAVVRQRGWAGSGCGAGGEWRQCGTGLGPFQAQMAGGALRRRWASSSDGRDGGSLVLVVATRAHLGPIWASRSTTSMHDISLERGTGLLGLARSGALQVWWRCDGACRRIEGDAKRGLIRLKRIYNFWCSMLVFTPFAYCFVTLRGTFMHFLELTY
jgi:hypothetical protein